MALTWTVAPGKGRTFVLALLVFFTALGVFLETATHAWIDPGAVLAARARLFGDRAEGFPEVALGGSWIVFTRMRSAHAYQPELVAYNCQGRTRKVVCHADSFVLCGTDGKCIATETWVSAAKETQLAVWNLDSGDTKMIARAFELSLYDSNGRWVVWRQGPGGPPRALIAYDICTSRTIELDRHTLAPDALAMDDERAVWARQEGPSTWSLYAYDFRTERKEQLSVHPSEVACLRVAGPYLAWLSATGNGSGDDSSDDGGHAGGPLNLLHLLDTRTGAMPRFPADPGRAASIEGAFRLTRDVLWWVSEEGINWLSLNEGTRGVIQVAGAILDLSACGDTVAWVEAAGSADINYSAGYSIGFADLKTGEKRTFATGMPYQDVYSIGMVGIGRLTLSERWLVFTKRGFGRELIYALDLGKPAGPALVAPRAGA
jgi:hypothetical protein